MGTLGNLQLHFNMILLTRDCLGCSQGHVQDFAALEEVGVLNMQKMPLVHAAQFCHVENSRGRWKKGGPVRMPKAMKCRSSREQAERMALRLIYRN